MIDENALIKKIRTQEDGCRNFGFYWTNFNQIIEQIESECDEIRDAVAKGDRTHLREEVGDLIHAVVILALYFEMNPCEILEDSVNKFQKRYGNLVKIAKQEGFETLKGQPMDILLNFWNKAKKNSLQPKQNPENN